MYLLYDYYELAGRLSSIICKFELLRVKTRQRQLWREPMLSLDESAVKTDPAGDHSVCQHSVLFCSPPFLVLKQPAQYY